MVPPQCGGTGGEADLTPSPFPSGQGSDGPPLRRGDGRNMLRPYGLTRTYPSQRGWREGGHGSYSWG